MKESLAINIHLRKYDRWYLKLLSALSDLPLFTYDEDNAFACKLDLFCEGFAGQQISAR